MNIKEKELSQINENSLLHFATIESYNDIEKYGIRREFTNNTIEQATTYKTTFSKGPIGLLKMTDMWISNLIYSVGLDKYFSSLVSFSATEYSEIKDNYNRLYREGKINIESFINDVYEYLDRFLISDIILEINNDDDSIIKATSDNYELDKTYNFDREIIREKLEYLVSGVVTTNDINLIVSDNKASAKGIIKQLYNEYKGLSFDYLDGFMEYINDLRVEPKLRRKN